MISAPKVGTIGEIRFTVEAKHAIDFANHDMPPVLATPWLIWFLEHAAREAVLPCLETGESTVGTHVDIEHIAATPLGHQVICHARIVHTESPVVSLQLEARDEQELIARGFHKLRIIDCARFANRLKSKTNPPSPPGR